jgi:hypothetical protein
LPVFSTNGAKNGEGTRGGGDPIHKEGIVPSVPGLYFVGLHFLYAMSSATLIGIGRDSERIVDALALRTSQAASAAKRRLVESVRREKLVPAADQANIAEQKGVEECSNQTVVESVGRRRGSRIEIQLRKNVA